MNEFSQLTKHYRRCKSVSVLASIPFWGGVALVVLSCAPAACQPIPTTKAMSAHPTSPAPAAGASDGGAPDGGATSRARQVHGSLPKEVLRGVIRRHLDEVRICYENGLKVIKDLEGRVVVTFLIGSTGDVQGSYVQSSTLQPAGSGVDARSGKAVHEVEQCLIEVVRTWRFPEPIGGGLVIVTYPFVLRFAPNDGAASDGQP
jgi:hypothetical protein